MPEKPPQLVLEGRKEFGRRGGKVRFVIEDWDEHCRRFLGMKLIPTTNIYGGDCPFCGGKKSFYIWVEKREVRCFDCGLRGRI